MPVPQDVWNLSDLEMLRAALVMRGESAAGRTVLAVGTGELRCLESLDGHTRRVRIATHQGGLPSETFGVVLARYYRGEACSEERMRAVCARAERGGFVLVADYDPWPEGILNTSLRAVMASDVLAAVREVYPAAAKCDVAGVMGDAGLTDVISWPLASYSTGAVPRWLAGGLREWARPVADHFGMATFVVHAAAMWLESAEATVYGPTVRYTLGRRRRWDV